MHRARAFTLLEAVLVVLIINVIAAIVLPRVSAGVSRAAPVATTRDVFEIQKQIEMYAIEHNGVYPGASGDGANAAHTENAFLAQLTLYTDHDGVVSLTPSARFRFGPYLRKGIPRLPVGPKAGLSRVNVVTGATVLTYLPSAAAGWLYNDTSGEFLPNHPTDLKTIITVGVGAESESLDGDLKTFGVSTFGQGAFD